MKARLRLQELRAVMELAATRRSDAPAIEVRRWWNELGVLTEEMHDMAAGNG